MATYTPDLWVIIKLDNDGEEVYKLLATWRGGFASGDSWKLNSGITEVSYDAVNDEFNVKGYSGSTYNVAPENWGMSFYAESILAGWKEDHPGKITLLGKADSLTFLNSHATAFNDILATN